jgi:hypothetical protein
MCKNCNEKRGTVLLFYNVRGTNRTDATGRIILKGNYLCDRCAEKFENIP